MKKLITVAYVFAHFWDWVKARSQDIAVGIGVIALACGVFLATVQMRAVGREHEIDAIYLETKYLKEKRQWAMGCIREIASRNNGGTPESIDACEGLAESLFPPKDFSKVAMLNWERQQLGVVIYEEDPMKE